MDRVVGIVNARVKSATDGVFDIESECLKEPLPQSLNRCVVDTLDLEHQRKLFCIEIRCIGLVIVTGCKTCVGYG